MSNTNKPGLVRDWKRMSKPRKKVMLGCAALMALAAVLSVVRGVEWYSPLLWTLAAIIAIAQAWWPQAGKKESA